MSKRAWTMIVAAVVVLGGCGGPERKVEPPVAPARAADSPVYGIPLPEGAVPDAERSTPGFEAFVVPAKKTSFGDIEAFYRRETDGKPFRNYSWCGATSDDRGLRIERVWKRKGSEDVFTLSLQQDPDSGPRITAATASTLGQQCPPPPLDRESPE